MDLWQALNPMTGVFTRREDRWRLREKEVTRTWRQRAQKPRNTGGYWEPHKRRGRQGTGTFFLGASRRNQPCAHLDLGLLGCWAVTEYISVIVSHQITVIFYRSSRKLLEWACNNRVVSTP